MLTEQNRRKPRLILIPPQHLGHELHVSRVIICDMFKRGFLSSDYGDIIVTGLRDRIFFYDSIIGPKNVICLSDLPNFEYIIKPPKSLSEYFLIDLNYLLNFSDFRNYDIINLQDYSVPPTYCTFTENAEMKKIGYDIPKYFFDDDFIKIAKRFTFSSEYEINSLIQKNENLFIVIHHRYDSSIENLKKILSKFSNDLLKIIFTNNINVLKNQFQTSDNICLIDDLKLYSTILNDQRCKLLISEWSGGGQISQYILGTQGVVWYYYDHYPDIYNFTATHKIWEKNALLGDYFNCWDFKCISGCNIQHFSNLDSLLNYRP